MMKQVDFSRYNNEWYKPGRNSLIRTIWFLLNGMIMQNSWNPSSSIRVWLLRLFGARIGTGVNIKPSVNVKYPWNLEIGDNSWIGEQVWIDSLDRITIGRNVCISQGSYLCTGNHNWTDPAFGLIVKPIIVEDGAWIGARTVILPGVTVGSHSIITAGITISKNTTPYMIYSQPDPIAIKTRTLF